MAERALPGVGLKGFDDPEADGWNVWTDENWRIVSALLQGRVLSVLSGVPGSPANGDMHILTSGGNAQKIAVRDNGAWVYITPQEGWRMFDLDTKLTYVFDGSAWGTTMSFGNISLFPGASITPTVNGQMTFQLTSDTNLEIKVRGSDGTVRSGSITLA